MPGSPKDSSKDSSKKEASKKDSSKKDSSKKGSFDSMAPLETTNSKYSKCKHCQGQYPKCGRRDCGKCYSCCKEHCRSQGLDGCSCTVCQMPRLERELEERMIEIDRNMKAQGLPGFRD